MTITTDFLMLRARMNEPRQSSRIASRVVLTFATHLAGSSESEYQNRSSTRNIFVSGPLILAFAKDANVRSGPLAHIQSVCVGIRPIDASARYLHKNPDFLQSRGR